MANILKCHACNVVINECLTFVQNKIQVMDNESLIRVCVTGFTEKDISDAKTLLFEAVTTGKRKITRKKEGKIQRDLEDIISVFKETDPEKIPIFVARDLYKLPPICFDSVDVTHILKKLLVLQEEVKVIKETFVTKDMLLDKERTESIQQIVATPSPPKEIVPSYRFLNVNNKRGASRLSPTPTMDSGPMGLSPLLNKMIVQPATQDSSVNMECDSLCVRNNTTTAKYDHSLSKLSECDRAAPIVVSQKLQHETPKRHSAGSAVPTCTSSGECQTMAEVLTADGEWKKNKPTEEWIQVNRRRYRNRLDVCTGKALNNSLGNFKAAESKIALYISNVHKETSDKDISDYIFENTKEKVKLTKIHMKRERDYNAFKLWVPKCKVDLFLRDQLWPEGINFRQFVYFKNGDGNTAKII